MQAIFQRAIAAALLAVLTAPGVGSAALSLHLALEDHSHEDGFPLTLSELAHAATHGHHHSAEATPEHDHQLVDAQTPVLRPGGDRLATFPPAVEPGSLLAERPRPGRMPRDAPPPPLFSIHCSLLL